MRLSNRGVNKFTKFAMFCTISVFLIHTFVCNRLRCHDTFEPIWHFWANMSDTFWMYWLDIRITLSFFYSEYFFNILLTFEICSNKWTNIKENFPRVIDFHFWINRSIEICQNIWKEKVSGQTKHSYSLTISFLIMLS